MITKEMLEASGTKAWLQKNSYVSLRDPDTIVGFLSKEKINELTRNCDNKQAINLWGLTVFNDSEVCFFTDDSKYGYGVLPPSFGDATYGCGSGLPFRIQPRPTLPLGMVETAEDVLNYLYPNYRHLNTVEELLEYLNK